MSERNETPVSTRIGSKCRRRRTFLVPRKFRSRPCCCSRPRRCHSSDRLRMPERPIPGCSRNGSEGPLRHTFRARYMSRSLRFHRNCHRLCRKPHLAQNKSWACMCTFRRHRNHRRRKRFHMNHSCFHPSVCPRTVRCSFVRRPRNRRMHRLGRWRSGIRQVRRQPDSTRQRDSGKVGAPDDRGDMRHDKQGRDSSAVVGRNRPWHYCTSCNKYREGRMKAGNSPEENGYRSRGGNRKQLLSSHRVWAA
jgi:hypothetical protein